MLTYCKNCRRVHAAWTRLNDGLICGRCGTRERDQRIVPLKTQRAKPVFRASLRAIEMRQRHHFS